jgi:hypothetical protein
MSLEEQREQIGERYRRGDVDRRSALKELMMSGLSAVAAYAAIGEVTDTEEARAQQLTPDQIEIQQRFRVLGNLVTSQDIIKLLKEMRNVSGDENKRVVAQEISNVVKKYDDQKFLRIALRIFENDAKDLTQRDIYVKRPDIVNVDPNYATVCVSCGLNGLYVSVGS